MDETVRGPRAAEAVEVIGRLCHPGDPHEAHGRTGLPHALLERRPGNPLGGGMEELELIVRRSTTRVERAADEGIRLNIDHVGVRHDEVQAKQRG